MGSSDPSSAGNADALETVVGTDGGAAGGSGTSVLEPGAALGRYVVLEVLGAGGMGVVYAAYDPELDRKVAIKLLHPGAQDTNAAPLQREAQALAKLSHPNVVAVHDVGSVDDQLYLAMEFVHGQTLTQWRRTRHRSWSDVLEVFVEAGRGLAAAHDRGLVHRDFKPDNVMVDDSGRARVMDFGLARPAATEDDAAEDDGVVGTPAYMAPEQISREGTDARSDQFSFCVALWEALFRQRPFGGTSMVELATQIVEGRRRAPPRDHKVPAWLRRVVERGMSTQASERWPSMEVLVAELTRDRARQTRTLAGVALAVGAVATAVVAFQNSRSELCTGADAALAEVWTPQRRAQIEDAVLSSELSSAPTLWDRVGPALDEWTSAWIQMHTDSCRATRVLGEQTEASLDLRMACLEHSKQQLDAVAAVLERGEAGVVARSMELVDSLPELSGCRDLEKLRRQMPPPSSSVAPAVAEVRARLAEASADNNAGRYQASLAAVEEAERLCVDVDYPPVQLELLFHRAAALTQLGRYAEAEAEYAELQELAAKLNNRPYASMAATQRMFVLGTRLGRVAEAHAVRPVASGASLDDPKLRARYLIVEGQLALSTGDAATAETNLREAIRVAAELEGTDSDHVTRARDALAVVLRHQQKYEEAEKQFLHVLSVQRSVVGAEHPAVALTAGNLGNLYVQRDRYAEAKEQYELALSINRAVLGDEHSVTALNRSNLASVLTRLGRYEASERESREALRVFTATFPEDHVYVAAARHALADSLIRQERFNEALPLAEHAWRFFTDHSSSNNHRAATSVAYATALWETADVESRRRARDLAEGALVMAGDGALSPNDVEELRDWLRTHPAP